MTYPKLRARPVHNGYVIQRRAPPPDALAEGRVWSPDAAIVLPGSEAEKLARLFASAPGLYEAARLAEEYLACAHTTAENLRAEAQRGPVGCLPGRLHNISDVAERALACLRAALAAAEGEEAQGE